MVAGSDRKAKVHLHTDTPARAFRVLEGFATVTGQRRTTWSSSAAWPSIRAAPCSGGLRLRPPRGGAPCPAGGAGSPDHRDGRGELPGPGRPFLRGFLRPPAHARNRPVHQPALGRGLSPQGGHRAGLRPGGGLPGPVGPRSRAPWRRGGARLPRGRIPAGSRWSTPGPSRRATPPGRKGRRGCRGRLRRGDRRPRRGPEAPAPAPRGRPGPLGPDQSGRLHGMKVLAARAFRASAGHHGERGEEPRGFRGHVRGRGERPRRPGPDAPQGGLRSRRAEGRIRRPGDPGGPRGQPRRGGGPGAGSGCGLRALPGSRHRGRIAGPGPPRGPRALALAALLPEEGSGDRSRRGPGPLLPPGLLPDQHRCRKGVLPPGHPGGGLGQRRRHERLPGLRVEGRRPGGPGRRGKGVAAALLASAWPRAPPSRTPSAWPAAPRPRSATCGQSSRASGAGRAWPPRRAPWPPSHRCPSWLPWPPSPWASCPRASCP
ncbi:MAG: hypothetical protein MZU79_00310 [Anaerotruncus sp.]|nr:hypothetical protein [Anaerotruncus sp.]